MNPYGKKFYIKHKKVSVSSAREILPLVLKLVQPMSVVDVGCGLGSWLSVCEELGIEDILGVDGYYLDKSMLLIPEDKFQAANLSEPLFTGRRFDLAISMEVAEHIPEKYSDEFIDSLVRLAPVILFSAAIPHRGGDGHINEQWQDYWANLFQKRKYAVIDCIRSEVWNNENVAWWYRQNTLLYVRQDYTDTHIELKRMFDLFKGFPLRIVHPLLFEETADPRKMSLKKALAAIPFGVIRLMRKIINGFHK